MNGSSRTIEKVGSGHQWDSRKKIHEDIRVPAILLRQSLQHSGWLVGRIEWEKRKSPNRKVQW